MVRLFTDDELAELARPPRGEAAARGWRRGVDGYGVWRDHTVAFLTERLGRDAGSAAATVYADVEAAWVAWPDAAGPPDAWRDEELDGLARVEARWRAAHD